MNVALNFPGEKIISPVNMGYAFSATGAA